MLVFEIPDPNTTFVTKVVLSIIDTTCAFIEVFELNDMTSFINKSSLKNVSSPKIVVLPVFKPFAVVEPLTVVSSIRECIILLSKFIVEPSPIVVLQIIAVEFIMLITCIFSVPPCSVIISFTVNSDSKSVFTPLIKCLLKEEIDAEASEVEPLAFEVKIKLFTVVCNVNIFTLDGFV